MSALLGLAIRNIRRHLRRTFLTLASIAVGLAIVLWLQCILAGRNKNMIDTVTSTRTGHLQIYRAEYLKDRLIQYSFEPDLAKIAERLPPDSALSERVHLPSLVSSGEQSAPILLEGVDPASEPRITRIRDYLKEGEFLAPDPDPACESRQAYIGRGLAELLQVGIGNKIVLMAQAADSSLGNDLLRVKGIFESGSPDFDKSFVFAPLSCVRKIGAIQGAHELVIRLPEESAIPVVHARLQQGLPPGLTATTWREALPALATMLTFNDATVVMVSLMLFSVITLGIVNTLLIGIFERTREFGVMIALGTTPGELRLMVVLESLLIGLSGALIGTGLGMLAVAYHAKFGFDLRPFLGNSSSVDEFKLDLIVFPVFQLLPFLKSVGVTLLFVLGASLYPAFRASRLNPIDAMRSV